MSKIRFACPGCKGPLEMLAPDRFRCVEENIQYDQHNGIWHFLSPDQQSQFSIFINDYEKIRAAEGRGSDNSEWYRALPYDNTSPFKADWRIRARSYKTLIANVIKPLQKQQATLNILDLGAGNGWLSYRLAQYGHNVIAIDLLLNDRDGLGAHYHYDQPFITAQAGFDQLPVESDQVDLVIFNASLHYSIDYAKTLRESLRVLKQTGNIIILDSPVYHDPTSGQQMVKEREAYFSQKFGTPSNALASEHYLTYARLASLADELSLSLRWHTPFYGLRWRLRPLKARLTGHREPARFHVIIGGRISC